MKEARLVCITYRRRWWSWCTHRKERQITGLITVHIVCNEITAYRTIKAPYCVLNWFLCGVAGYRIHNALYIPSPLNSQDVLRDSHTCMQTDTPPNSHWQPLKVTPNMSLWLWVIALNLDRSLLNLLTTFQVCMSDIKNDTQSPP